MADEDNVLFVRNNPTRKSVTTHSDDVWDDTALIKAYDKAVNLAKDEVAKRMGVEVHSTTPHSRQNKSQNQKQNRHAAKSYKKWVLGSPCRAVWSDDGEVYEAVIQKIHESSGTCVVKFIGYENSEKVEISSLAESLGLESQIAQTKVANADTLNNHSVDLGESASAEYYEVGNPDAEDTMECDNDYLKLPKQSFTAGPSFGWPQGSIPPAPPLPPQLMTRLPENDGDALSSMLMSWYISGFHTGYYHGIKQAKENQQRRK